MSNIIEVIYSEDWTDCETCGGGCASSTLIKFGDYEVGKWAMATCFDSDYADSYFCFSQLFDHLELEKPSVNQHGYISDEEFISKLKDCGYTVTIRHEDLSFEYYDDYDCDCQNNSLDCEDCYPTSSDN